MDVEMRKFDGASKGSQISVSDADADAVMLAQMGKKQVFKRNFGFMSMLSFSCTILITWEAVLLLFQTGLQNGGLAGLVYQYIMAWGGTLCTFVSICELASMAPTAGGQYHWVAMLSPRPMRNFLSYMTGWMTVLAWLSNLASGLFLAASIIQGLALINWPEYATKAAPYQITLIAWAVILLCVFFNTVIARVLPKVEGGLLIIHILGFFALMIPLVYYAPHGSASDVFSSFVNGGGWSTYGTSFMVGSLGSVFAFTGADAAVHMSEEIKNPAVNVPRSVFFSLIFNGCLGFGMLLAVVFCIGDVEAVLELTKQVGFPFIAVFIQATGSVAAGTGMSVVIIVLAISAAVGVVATCSRIIWSFARDKGLPFSNILSRVTTKSALPAAAIAITCIIPGLLNLIVIGSTVAFNALISLSLVAYYFTYFVSIALLLYRRLTSAIRNPDPSAPPTPVMLNQETGEYDLSWGPWRVPGWLGITINITACAYLLVIFIFAFFPPTTPVNAVTMSYSSLMFGATVLYSIAYYYIWAKKNYNGPVVEIAL